MTYEKRNLSLIALETEMQDQDAGMVGSGEDSFLLCPHVTKSSLGPNGKGTNPIHKSTTLKTQSPLKEPTS
jgi:hypothetical protein